MQSKLKKLNRTRLYRLCTTNYQKVLNEKNEITIKKQNRRPSDQYSTISRIIPRNRLENEISQF